MPSKYTEYNKSHHSGGTPEERLKYRTLNSGKGDASFNSRNHPRPDYVISEPRAWANIHKASQSAPPDDVLQPGRGLRGLLEPGDWGMARAKSGGGYTSNKRREVPVKTGKPSTWKINPAGAAQLGAHLGDHVTNRARVLANPATRLRDGTMAQVDAGNRRAVECPQGPGGGRVVQPHGFQALQGRPVQGENVPGARDILSEYGKESAASQRRRGGG